MVQKSRRKFLHLVSVGSAFMALNPLLTWANRKKNKSSISHSNRVIRKPIVLSTWYNEAVHANEVAWKILSTNGRALDAVEQAARATESEINNCCVGLNGSPDRDGIVTLDACIMDEFANCGSVAGLEQIDHPITVARMVMEKTPHVMLVGSGAQQFAVENNFELKGLKLSTAAETGYKKWLEKANYLPTINIEKGGKKSHGPFMPYELENQTYNHDTIGIIAMDVNGNLSGACTTSGMAYKLHGRVGDSPIIGAGLFVDNEIGAATATGVGEEVMRTCGSHLVVEFMRQGNSPENACKLAVERIMQKSTKNLKELQVGFIAINKNGEYGGYALQKGFDFGVYSHQENNIKVDCKNGL